MSFLENKNISTQKYAAFIALISTLLLIIVFVFQNIHWETIGISAFVFFTTIYFLVYYIFEKFIYLKIKLIYKFISQTKSNYKEDILREIGNTHLTLEDVNKDVKKWAKEHRTEIETFQKNESFRKEFLMNLAHELKTPIFTVQGYIQTLQDGAINNLEVRDSFLNNANLGMERLSDLVSDLDQISKLEGGEMKIQKSKFIIQNLVKEVFQEFEMQAQKNNITLRIETGCEGAIEVHADRPKIKQVLVNLISNSIKYGNENGETKVGIYTVDDKNGFIEISDNGIGIAEENILRVFERFYRTDKGRSRSVGGSGLGLAIVKHIIEAHGHSVTCRSTLNVGSSFGFWLDK